MNQPVDRLCGHLTSPAAAASITRDSILCLPVGSFEQHGPHLPLSTDTIIAQSFAVALAEQIANQHDVWVLPPVPLGLSREHRWATGTASLQLDTFATLITQFAAQYTRSTGARRLVITNGHGGNRGALEALLYELEDDLGIAACALHPLALAGAGKGAPTPEIHAGFVETSLMLHLAPHLVQCTDIPDGPESDEQASAVRESVLARGASWPWRSDHCPLARDGVIGDPRGASSELGQTIMADAIRAAIEHLDRLADVEPGSMGADRRCC
jgi:creatinine amidohydrolase